MEKLSRNYTDFLKIIAALLVVVGHYSNASILQGWSSSFVWWALASQCGYIGVAIFFFLSGYGLSESDRKHHLPFGDFVRKRFLKIYRPVLLVTLIWIAVEFAFMNKQGSWQSILYSVFWGFDDCVLWFVKILFGLYAAFFAFSEFAARQKGTSAWLVLVLSSLCLMFIANQTEGYSSIGIPCFCIGVLLSRCKKLLPIIVCLLIGVGGGIGFTLLTKDNQGIHAAINYVTIVAALLAYRLVSGLGSKSKNKYTSLCAAITFDLYLTHMKAIEVLIKSNCLRKEYGGGNFLITIAVCIAASIVFYYFRTYIHPQKKR